MQPARAGKEYRKATLEQLLYLHITSGENGIRFAKSIKDTELARALVLEDTHFQRNDHLFQMNDAFGDLAFLRMSMMM